MPQEKIEIFKSLDNWAKKNVLIHLKPVEQSWQPHDFLPDSASQGFDCEQFEERKERAKEIPDDYLVVLVGDMISEEALPAYLTSLHTLDGVNDETGTSLSPWAIWTRAWSAEENRQGSLLNKYLYLSGRVDMRQIEKTIQYLIGFGMDFRTENNPYMAFIYTSFQERAAFITHGNTARLAKEHGDINLAQICGTIASDEKRHERAYTTIVEKLFEIDPDAVSQRLGVYTAKYHADILDFLVEKWKVQQLTGLSADGRKAQDYVCRLAPTIRRLGERVQERAKQAPKVSFSWIFNRQVKL
ncbi:hypothetical protein PTKIN_Ptkin17bG0024900 [Pterospermum kingtungense]